MPLDPQDRDRARREAIARRRKTFVALLWLAGATLLLGMFPAFRFLLTVHLLADLMLAGFVAYLVWDRRTLRESSYRPRHSANHQESEEEFELLRASQF